KDPAFFNTVVKPYLANKKDRTFLDDWLIGSDVSGYLDPWRHARLNAVERVLLAQRLAGEPARAARHLDELVRLLPPNAARDLRLCDTALQANELKAEGTLRRDMDALKPTLERPSAATFAAGTGPVPTAGGGLAPGAIPTPTAPPPPPGLPPADPAAPRE